MWGASKKIPWPVKVRSARSGVVPRRERRDVHIALRALNVVRKTKIFIQGAKSIRADGGGINSLTHTLWNTAVKNVSVYIKLKEKKT